VYLFGSVVLPMEPVIPDGAARDTQAVVRTPFS
jgi:hypothetical protein